MKILKLLASKSKRSELMVFLRNDKFMMMEGDDQILHFLRYFLLKMTSGLKNFPGYVFFTHETQKGHQNCPKIYWY